MSTEKNGFSEFLDLVPDEGYATPAAQMLINVLIDLTSSAPAPVLSDDALLAGARKVVER